VGATGALTLQTVHSEQLPRVLRRLRYETVCDGTASFCAAAKESRCLSVACDESSSAL